MNVIAFQPRMLQLDGPWRTGELNAMVETLMPEATRPGGLGWDVGLTEIGDPQFYLLGPPQDECLLCISRIGRRYVLEDGAERPLAVIVGDGLAGVTGVGVLLAVERAAVVEPVDCVLRVGLDAVRPVEVA